MIIKAGVAGEDWPRSVFPTVVGRPKYFGEKVYCAIDAYIDDEACAKASALNIKQPIENSIVTNWDDMEKIWQHTFYNKLHVEPVEHPVFLTEPPIVPKGYREKMIQIMFETFNVPAYCDANQCLLSLYTAGPTTGIVLDVGGDTSKVCSIYGSYPINDSVVQHNIAGRDITEYLRKLLNKKGYNFSDDFYEMEIIRDIKEKHGYVAYDFDDEMGKAANTLKSNALCTLLDGNVITIPNEGFRYPELLFKPRLNGFEFEGIETTLFNSINKCDINIRKDLYNNIVLSGGSTMFEGFRERIEKEIVRLAPPNMKINVILVPDFKYSSWIGGSVYALFATYVTHDEYNESGPSIVHCKCTLKNK